MAFADNLRTTMTLHVNTRRRGVLRGLAAAPLLASGLPARARSASATDPWAAADRIQAAFAQPLRFRAEDFPITAFGARPCEVVPVDAWVSFTDEATIKTPAPGAADSRGPIAAAIAACHAAGGGRVLIPAGNWLCKGPIVLLSNVHVHLAAGAHVYFGNDPLDYARYGDVDCGPNGKLVLTRWEGNDCLNYSPLVYARGQDNIALTGDDWTSVLDGQAGVPFADSPDCWWSWKGRVRKGIDHVPHTPGRTEVAMNPANPASFADVIGKLVPGVTLDQARAIQGDDKQFQAEAHYLRALSEARVPAGKRVFGIGHYLRPHMLQFISCTRVLLAGYQTTNTPFWQHNPVDCSHVHVKGIFANSMGPNNDGFDPESCRDVLIEDCQFNTGDDCIAIDSGKGTDIQYGPAENIVIQHCRMQSGHGALTLGSIMGGGIRNVYARHLVFENANWKTDPLNIAIRLKTNMSRGGYLRNFHVLDVQIPNGIRTTPAFYTPAPGSGIAARTYATGAGAVVTFDCDYDQGNDSVRTRPPVVEHVRISRVTVGNVATPGGAVSCYQPVVIVGPVASTYNGPGKPAVLPVRDVVISDCDFGTPVKAAPAAAVVNARDIVLRNVKVAGKTVNATFAG
jgi:polygalacturonase